MLLFRSRGRVVNILFNLKKKNCLGNKKSLSLMSSIVALCFKKKVAVQAPFRHRYRFKSIGLAPVSEKTQTIPIPKICVLSDTYLCVHASSTALERVFSCAGHAISQERCRILPEKANMLIFLQKNCRSIDAVVCVFCIYLYLFKYSLNFC